jgi:TRAP-type transport system periplasmic protein
MKFFSVSSLVVAASLALAGTVRAEQLTLSTPDADTSEITLAAKHFAELVKQKTNGELEIRVFPNGTLYGGDPSAAVKQLAGGSLDMLLNATSLYATFNPKFTAIAVPYLFDDVEQLRAYLRAGLAM